MPQPKFEVALGPVDGFNADFSTTVPYTLGTLAVLLNGQLLNPTQFTPTSSGAGTFRMTEAPRVGDIVQAFYTDTSPALPAEVVFSIEGRIEPWELHGEIVQEVEIFGRVTHA